MQPRMRRRNMLSDASTTGGYGPHKDPPSAERSSREEAQEGLQRPGDSGRGAVLRIGSLWD